MLEFQGEGGGEREGELHKKCECKCECVLSGPWSINFFCFSACSFIHVCMQCINFQDLCASLLGDIPPSFMLLTFISCCFVIDFLSILKVIIFSTIATDDCHHLRLHSIYQNAPNSLVILFRYIAQPSGVRYTYCTHTRTDMRSLSNHLSSMLASGVQNPVPSAVTTPL